MMIGLGLVVLQSFQWNEAIAKTRSIRWDRGSRHTNLGDGPLSLISCLSVRTAREYQIVSKGCRRES